MSSISVKLLKMKTNHIEAEKVRKALVIAVDKRFGEIEKNKTITSAIILDPRFKSSCFLDTENKNKSISNLRDELSILFNI